MDWVNSAPGLGGQETIQKKVNLFGSQQINSEESFGHMGGQASKRFHGGAEREHGLITQGS